MEVPQIDRRLSIFSIRETEHILSPVDPIKTLGLDPSLSFSYHPHSLMPPNFDSSQTNKQYGRQLSTLHSPLSTSLPSHSQNQVLATMEENTLKSPAQDSAAEAALKKPRTPVINDDDVLAWLLMEGNDSDGELLNLLEPVKDTARGTVKVRFIENPYSSLLVFQSSSSYITINGNEESCGSSFSDSDTSMMASVDMSGLSFDAAFGNVMCTAAEERSASGSVDEATREEASVYGEGMDGADGFDWDDHVLARFLGEQVFSDSENH